MTVRISYITPYPTKQTKHGHWIREWKMEEIHHSLVDEFVADLEMLGAECILILEKGKYVQPDILGRMVFE